MFWSRPAAWLRVSGADAATFLQGQFTQELRNLSGDAAYGLWLNVKGKVIADSFVLREDENAFRLASYFSSAALIRDRLESFVIADDVIIEDHTDQAAMLTLFDCNLVTARERWTVSPGDFLFTGRRARTSVVEWILSETARDAMRTQFHDVREFAPEEVAFLRLDAAIPAIPADVGSADLPNEAGLDVSAISYTKGCYLGQEVMARLRSMGSVRRRLLRVTAEKLPELPILPAPLFSTERQVGELRSIARGPNGHCLGFAMLSLLQVKPGMELSLSPQSAPSFRLIDSP